MLVSILVIALSYCFFRAFEAKNVKTVLAENKHFKLSQRFFEKTLHF